MIAAELVDWGPVPALLGAPISHSSGRLAWDLRDAGNAAQDLFDPLSVVP